MMKAAVIFSKRAGFNNFNKIIAYVLYAIPHSILLLKSSSPDQPELFI